MPSGPSGKHKSHRRSVPSPHWEALDRAAEKMGTNSAKLVSDLLAEILTDTTSAIARCKRIKAATK